jgi:hypothetical protein
MGFTEEQVLLVKVQPIGDMIEALQSSDRLTTQFYEMFNDCCFAGFSGHAGFPKNVFLLCKVS